jgi:hypothetical protein
MMAKFAVKMFGYDGEESAEISLPFAPIPSMYLQCPFDSMNYRQIEEVFWNENEGKFHIFLFDFNPLKSRKAK